MACSTPPVARRSIVVRAALPYASVQYIVADGRPGGAARRTPGPGAFLLRCLMDPPWAVRLEDESPLSVTAVVRGQAVGAAGRR